MGTGCALPSTQRGQMAKPRLTGRPPLGYSSHHSNCLPPLDQNGRGLCPFCVIMEWGRVPPGYSSFSSWRKVPGRKVPSFTVGPSF